MLVVLEAAALEAGKAILPFYKKDCPVHVKSDASPVTQADEVAEAIILRHLEAAYPDIPVVAEEATAAGRVPDISGGRFFLVDPLDGTREFIDDRAEFTVNIALIEAGVPRAGIVYAPALGIAFVGEDGRAEKLVIDENFCVSSRSEVRVRATSSPPVGLASRCNRCSETEDFLQDNAVERCTMIGSSLKFCLLAEGAADVYPRFSRTMEWDTAAGDAVLRAAGGITLDLAGLPLAYGKRDQISDSDFANPSFISWGRTKV